MDKDKDKIEPNCPQTSRKRKPKNNDDTKKKKLKAEKAGSSTNTLSVGVGRYGRFSVVDRQQSPSPPRQSFKKLQSSHNCLASTISTSSSSLLSVHKKSLIKKKAKPIENNKLITNYFTTTTRTTTITSAALEAVVAAAASSVFNIDHEIVDLVTPPSSQVNTFTPSCSESSNNNKNINHDDEDDNDIVSLSKQLSHLSTDNESDNDTLCSKRNIVDTANAEDQQDGDDDDVQQSVEEERKKLSENISQPTPSSQHSTKSVEWLEKNADWFQQPEAIVDEISQIDSNLLATVQVSVQPTTHIEQSLFKYPDKLKQIDASNDDNDDDEDNNSNNTLQSVSRSQTLTSISSVSNSTILSASIISNKTTSSGRQISAGEQKFKNLKNFREQVITMGLKPLLGIDKNTPNTNYKYKVYNKVIDSVKKISEWSVASSIFVEFLINHEDGWMLKDIVKNKPQKSINNAFNIMRSDCKINYDKNLIKLHEEFTKLRPDIIHSDTKKILVKHDTSGLARIVADVCKSYLTIFQTNITTHGYRRLRDYIKFKNDITTADAKKIMDNLIKKNIHPPDISLFDNFKNLNFKLFSHKDKWYEFLSFFLELQKITLKFVVVPIYKYGWKHIRLSTSALREFKQHIDGITKRKASEVTADLLWNEMMNIKPETILGKKFGLSATTNGVEICLLCYVPISKNSTSLISIEKDITTKEKIPKITILSNHTINTIKKMKFSRYVAIDPGLRCPITGIIFNDYNDLDNKNKEKRYCQRSTTLLYKNGFFRNEKIRKKITSTADKRIEDIVKMDQFKNLNLKNAINYKQNLKFRLLCYYELQQIYGQLKIVKINWNKKIQRRKALDREANFLAYGFGSKKNLKKKIVNDEVKKTKNQKLHNKKNNTSVGVAVADAADDAKTKYQINRAKKLLRQQELAAKNKLKFTPAQLLQRKNNRIREQQKKKLNKALKNELLKKKALNFRKKQINYQECKKLYENNPHQYQQQQQQQQHNDKNDKLTVVFIGQSKIVPTAKGYRRPPLMKLEKKLITMKNVVVVRVDEYKTTKNCSICKHEAIVSVAGHRYTYCPHCKITWHRDINAARSIGKIGLSFSGINPNDPPSNYNAFNRTGQSKK